MRKADMNQQPNAQRIARRTVLQSMLAAALAPAALSTIRTADAQDVNALLQESAKAMAAVKSFVFSINTVQGKTVLFGNLELQGVEGAVERPDRFKADITVGASIVSLTVKVIGIGDKVWVTNPMSSDQAFTEASTGGGESSAATIASVLNPDKLFLAAVQAIQNPTIDGTEKIDDLEMTKVKGTVNLANVTVPTPFASPVASAKEAVSDFLDLSDKTLTAWIDATGLIHRLELAGAITKDESSDVIRQIDLSHFNESQNIQPPTATATAG
jgi:hypothetical protein